MTPVRLVPTLLLLGLPACVQLSYTSRWTDGAPHPELLQQLQPGVDGLHQCLARLGAPRFVWEYSGDGAALGWVYSDGSTWGLSARYSFNDLTGVSFDFDSDTLQLPGAVLWFGPDLRLERWQEGKLADLTTGLRRSPAPIDVDAR